jgi:glycosidase
MTKEHAAWIDSAVIYEITPSHFVSNATYDDITAKLPELKKLGINTIWLQPVFKTGRGGQGYDITDYFSLRTDLGDERGLRQLIAVAKSLNLRVLFDFVINHTSISHPYAQDVMEYGKASHYYHFYQHENDGVKYSSRYKKDKYGFINYFWDNLVNLDYNNPEVQQWIIEACKYWVRDFDIDGYRFDAVWAVNARAPRFGIRLRDELKSIKPDLLLLAEDKASTDDAYRSGFDAAYDWTADTSWVSQWSWQHEYKGDNNTIFKFHDVKQRVRLLDSALFNNGSTSKLRLRFVENNDLPRFIKSHDLGQVKMVSALVFALPGLPLIYNGQETGFTGHPYTKKPIFMAGQSIQSLDSNNHFDYYQELIRLRMRYPALRDTAISKISVSHDSAIIAFHRWKNNEHFIVMMNLDSISTEATIDPGELKTPFSTSKKYFLKDLLSGDSFTINRDNTSGVKIFMNGYEARWLLFDSGKK